MKEREPETVECRGCGGEAGVFDLWAPVEDEILYCSEECYRMSGGACVIAENGRPYLSPELLQTTGDKENQDE